MKIKPIMSVLVLKSYCSLIIPLSQYCTLIWANTYFSRLEQIRVLQKKAVRINNNYDYIAPTDPLFKINKLLKLDDVNNL